MMCVFYALICDDWLLRAFYVVVFKIYSLRHSVLLCVMFFSECNVIKSNDSLLGLVMVISHQSALCKQI